MWLISLSVHLVGIVGYNLLLRKSITKVDKWLLATIMQTGIAIPAAVFSIIFPFQIPSYSSFDYFLIAATIVLTMLFHACNVKALQYLEASVFSVIYNTRFITVTLLGVFLLSEKLTPLQILGGLLIFCSVFLVRQKEKIAVTKRGLLFGFATAFLIGFINLTEKLLNQNVGFLEYFAPSAIICALIMWTIVFIRKTKVSLPFLIKPGTISLMGFRAMSAFGFSLSLVYGPIALSNYISSLSVVLTVLFGALFLNERDYLLSKILATIVAVAGLSLIFVGDIIV